MRRRRPGDGHDRRASQLNEVADVTADELEELLRSEERLVLVDFWTPSCEPCRELRPHLELLAAEGGDLCSVVAVDVQREPSAAERHAVREYPTLVFFKGGRELRRVRSGALPASTLRLLAEL